MGDWFKSLHPLDFPLTPLREIGEKNILQLFNNKTQSRDRFRLLYFTYFFGVPVGMVHSLKLAFSAPMEKKVMLQISPFHFTWYIQLWCTPIMICNFIKEWGSSLAQFSSFSKQFSNHGTVYFQFPILLIPCGMRNWKYTIDLICKIITAAKWLLHKWGNTDDWQSKVTIFRKNSLCLISIRISSDFFLLLIMTSHKKKILSFEKNTNNNLQK